MLISKSEHSDKNYKFLRHALSRSLILSHYWNHHSIRNNEKLKDVKNKVGVDLRPFRFIEAEAKANVNVFCIYIFYFSITSYLRISAYLCRRAGHVTDVHAITFCTSHILFSVK